MGVPSTKIHNLNYRKVVFAAKGRKRKPPLKPRSETLRYKEFHVGTEKSVEVAFGVKRILYD